MFGSPLEQFNIISLVPLGIVMLDFSPTNFLVINVACLILIVLISYYNNINFNSKNLKCYTFYLISNNWQKSIEIANEISAQLVVDIIATDKNKYFLIISLLLNYILLSNLIGLIPYSFTSTSHLIITFTLSFSVFIAINVLTVQKYGIKTFSLFLPANTTFFLALLLIPIEFVSYVAKPISLGVRLFINLMAGHSLLKVIVGFSWSILLFENFISLGFVVPIVVLIALFGLEFGVALIQAYVFVILTCIYLNEGIGNV